MGVGTPVCNSHWPMSLKRASSIREEALGGKVLLCEDRSLSAHVPQYQSLQLPAPLLEVPGLCFFTHLLSHLSFITCLLHAEEEAMDKEEVPKKAGPGKGREKACVEVPRFRVGRASGWVEGQTFPNMVHPQSWNISIKAAAPILGLASLSRGQQVCRPEEQGSCSPVFKAQCLIPFAVFINI